MHGGDTIPVSRTNGSYDIVATLSELTTTTEAIDIPRLSQALTTLGDTVNAASPHIRSTFTGLSRISQAIASRDDSIQQLLARADRVTKLLSQRRGDLVTLMKRGDLVFKELITRRQDIHSLLVNAERLAVELRGLATDNQAQIGDALKQLDHALTFLRGREKQLDTTLTNLGPYASILINIIGTGPWFDAFVPNLDSIANPTEFKQGKRP
jgi:phospholipid/cholesterol/gamma-HCH transport system substrate-binding protein